MEQDRKTEHIFGTQGGGGQAQGVSRFGFRKARPPFGGLYRAGAADQDARRNSPIPACESSRFSILDPPVAGHQETADGALHGGAPQPEISDQQAAPRP